MAKVVRFVFELHVELDTGETFALKSPQATTIEPVSMNAVALAVGHMADDMLAGLSVQHRNALYRDMEKRYGQDYFRDDNGPG